MREHFFLPFFISISMRIFDVIKRECCLYIRTLLVDVNKFYSTADNTEDSTTSQEQTIVNKYKI